MDANSPEEWFRRMPFITKVLAVGSFLVTVLLTLGLIGGKMLTLHWPMVVQRFHLWRLLSNHFVIGGFSFGWVFQMYFLTTFSAKLEENPIFSSSRGSYLYFILLQMLALDLASGILDFPYGRPALATSLHFAIIYYWSRRDPWAPVGLWGFTLQAYQLPFGLLAIDVMMGGSIWGDLLGLFTSHLYYFLKEILPNQGGFDLFSKIPCPKALDNFVDQMENWSPSATYQNVVGGQRTRGPPPPSGASSDSRPRPPGDAGGGTAWSSSTFSGRGHRLGGD